MIFERAANTFVSNPKALFLIDGVGAILSAILLGIVLVRLEPLFGIPKSTLYLLATLPCFFAAYDFYCYNKVKDNLGFFLKGIATINLLYCLLSIGLAIYHYEKITYLGWAYILIEILIVVFLAMVELRTSKKLIPKKNTTP